MMTAYGHQVIATSSEAINSDPHASIPFPIPTYGCQVTGSFQEVSELQSCASVSRSQLSTEQHDALAQNASFKMPHA